MRTISKHYHYHLGLYSIRGTQISTLHRFGSLVLARVMRTGRCPPVYPSAADLIMMRSTNLDGHPSVETAPASSRSLRGKAGRAFLHHRRSSLDEDRLSRQHLTFKASPLPRLHWRSRPLQRLLSPPQHTFGKCWVSFGILFFVHQTWRPTTS